MIKKPILLVLIITLLGFSSIALADESADSHPGNNTVSVDGANNDIETQLHLCDNYKNGDNGIKKDIAESIRCLSTIAEQGDPRAEYNLALVYFWGNEAEKKDYIRAYMWITLMVTQNNPEALALHDDAVVGRDKMEASMSTDDIIKSKAMVTEWLKNHPNLPKKNLP